MSDQLSLLDYMEETREIPLTRGKIAIVDASDFDWLNQWKWTYNPSGYGGYAERGYHNEGKLIRVAMHRQILSAPTGTFTDHINRNTLDNRRENLRLCTNQENQFNRGKEKKASSIYKGVSWSKQTSKWTAHVRKDRLIHLGYFVTEIEAAQAYDVAARKLFGEFARTNFKEMGS